MRGAKINEDGNVELNSLMRAVVGNCRQCGGVIVVLNMPAGGWPLAKCVCGWSGPTTDIINHAYFERINLTKVTA